jgi:hypothetical protein
MIARTGMGRCNIAKYGAKRKEGKTMTKLICVLIAAAIAAVSLPALGQNNNNNNPALAVCLQAADQKYKDTWEALCRKDGKLGRCIEFIGSPRDKEFSQLRIEEMTLCSKLYR